MQRNSNADLLKTIAIFGVVFIHGSSFLGGTKILNFIKDSFRFAVPCFIILWAYFFFKSYIKKNDLEKKQYRYDRFIHLFRVYLIWSLLYFVLTADWQNLTFQNIITTHFMGFGWAGQYFFIILFQLILLAPLFLAIYKRKVLYIAAIAIVFIIYVIYGYYYEILPEFLKKIGIKPFVFWLPYVFLGFYLSKLKISIINKFWLFIPLLIGLEFFIMEYFQKNHSVYITPSVLIISSLFVVFVLNSNSFKFPSIIEKLIKFIASNTLIIFVVNPLLILISQHIMELTSHAYNYADIPDSLKNILILVYIFIIFCSSVLSIKLLEIMKMNKILS